VKAVLELSLQIALGILFPALIIKKDLARLSPILLSRAWNDASLWAAVVVFGPICLLVHFARTRRSLSGFLLGLAWVAACGLASGLLSGLFELVA
jgi:hypothetical protein